MMMFDETIRAIWFTELHNGDWMAVINREADGKLSLTYRFRWYQDDKAFDSKDKKSWTKGRFEGPVDEDAVIAKLTELAEQIRGAANMRSDHECKSWVLIRGAMTLEAFVGKFREQPWVHTQEEPIN